MYFCTIYLPSFLLKPSDVCVCLRAHIFIWKIYESTKSFSWNLPMAEQRVFDNQTKLWVQILQGFKNGNGSWVSRAEEKHSAPLSSPLFSGKLTTTSLKILKNRVYIYIFLMNSKFLTQLAWVFLSVFLQYLLQYHSPFVISTPSLSTVPHVPTLPLHSHWRTLPSPHQSTVRRGVCPISVFAF